MRNQHSEHCEFSLLVVAAAQGQHIETPRAEATAGPMLNL